MLNPTTKYIGASRARGLQGGPQHLLQVADRVVDDAAVEESSSQIRNAATMVIG
jgi:hypothetical protein